MGKSALRLCRRCEVQNGGQNETHNMRGTNAKLLSFGGLVLIPLPPFSLKDDMPHPSYNTHTSH
jgi:hypothetical protein